MNSDKNESFPETRKTWGKYEHGTPARLAGAMLAHAERMEMERNDALARHTKERNRRRGIQDAAQKLLETMESPLWDYAEARMEVIAALKGSLLANAESRRDDDKRPSP